MSSSLLCLETHSKFTIYPVEYKFRRVYGLVCDYGGFQTAARQRNVGRLGLRRWTDWRDENEQQASVVPLPFVRRRGWQCQVHRARPTRCHELPLCLARPRRALSRVWAPSSSIGRAQGSWYALHRQSRRREKGAVSQPLLRRFFRRLLLKYGK